MFIQFSILRIVIKRNLLKIKFNLSFVLSCLFSNYFYIGKEMSNSSTYHSLYFVISLCDRIVDAFLIFF